MFNYNNGIENEDHKENLTQIKDIYCRRLDFIIEENFTVGSYLISGKRDELYCSFKRSLTATRFNSVLNFYYQLIRELKAMRIGTMAVSNENEIINQFTCFVNMPPEYYVSG